MAINEINSYQLSRNWFDYCFENPEKVRPIHTAIYFFAIEHCNRLGWKEKFGFPSQMVMEAIGVKNWRTYSIALEEIVGFGFIKMLEISKNQYSSNIIAIVKNTKANTEATTKANTEATTKALDKALSKHSIKHSQSTVSIDKQETINKKQETNIPEFSEFKEYAILNQFNTDLHKLELKYKAWSESGWIDGNGKKILNWKTKILNSLPYMINESIKDPNKKPKLAQ